MIDLKAFYTKILSAINRLPNFFDPDGGNGARRPVSANINSDNSGGVIQFLSTGSMTEGKPSNDGNILHFNWDNSERWASQLFIGHGTGGIQHRTQKDGSTWSPWYDVYYQPIEIQENANLNSYRNPGVYYCATNARAQTLSNCPVTCAFILEVVSSTSPVRDSSNTQYRM